jgi:nucleotide-binding universal stress UspA family protein
MPPKETSKAGPIVVAVDFSEYSAQALIWAAGISKCIGGPLLVLHVVHDPESAPGYYRHSKKWKKHLVRMEDAAAEMMDDFVNRLQRDHPKTPGLRSPNTKLVVGLPVTRILEVAEKTHAQMIVMGSQGRTGLSHLLLGSKAEKVAQLASIPVTIVKKAALAEDLD